jgi:hypothetical protein
VLRLDLTTGRATMVQRQIPGVWSWFVDSAGVVRAGVDYSNNRIRLFYRAGPGADLRRIDSRRSPRDGSVIDMIRFFSNADQGVVITNAVTGRFAVYNYNFATDTRGDAIFEHPQVDVTSVIMGEDDAIDGVRYEDDRSRIHWLDPELRGIQAVIDRALPNKVNLMLNRSRNGNHILIWSSAADDPGLYYVYDRAARRIEAFAAPYPQLQDRSFAAVRPISFRARDGTEIPGYLTLPPGRPERDLPLILMPHGGPFARDSWKFEPWNQFLASRGYAVLQVNFRGSTGYGRAYVERGYGQLGSNGQGRTSRDARAGGRAAAQRHVPRPPRERPRDPRPHRRQDAQEPDPRADRRRGAGRADALRPDQGPHHLPLQVTAPTGRHPELVSGSSLSRTRAAENWMLKQVQHDVRDMSCGSSSLPRPPDGSSCSRGSA